MAFLDFLFADPFTSVIAISTGLLIISTIYRISFHPLSHIPGPLLPKITTLWLWYHSYIGDEASVIDALHTRYGPYVRVSPNEVDISDADAIAPIYTNKGGFMKAPCYRNFDIDGHESIFSTLDPEHRAPRAKAVLPLFSTKSIRDNEGALYGCVERLVQRMREEASLGRPVNVLNLTRSLALDAVSTHLFAENYNGTAEKGRLSASAFVDAFVAVGRFFYLPTALFLWVEWAIGACFPSEHTTNSMRVVDAFVEMLVDGTSDEALNYPGRLLGAGMSRSETKAQCKDLMFAGTDSSGMNLATICLALAGNPEKYEILRSEILEYSRMSAKKDIQSLPYLTGVIKEGLRISMANPTRLPHIVPSTGWTFKGVTFPPNTLVGCAAYSLHFNPSIYESPRTFRPERWLDDEVTPEMNKHFFAFGAGARVCIARNLALAELYMATEKLVESDVLRGARPGQEKVEIYEWFNSSVKGEKIELIWDRGQKM